MLAKSTLVSMAKDKRRLELKLNSLLELLYAQEELYWPCRKCGEQTLLEFDNIEDFDPSMVYCGSNPYCCP